MNINLTNYYLYIILFLAVLPVLVVAWSLYKNKNNKQIIGYSLLAALLSGGVLQGISESHPHVPGSEIILFALEVVFTAIVLVVVLGIRFLYRKYKTT